MNKNADQTPQVSDFDLIRLIGEGGFGRVWLAKSQTTGRLRAVKLIPLHGQRRLSAVEFAKPFAKRAAIGRRVFAMCAATAHGVSIPAPLGHGASRRETGQLPIR